MNTYDAAMALEQGGESAEEEIRAMQALINSGSAWSLQGSTGRACMDAIRGGLCALGPSRHTDAYGNVVPSRFDVKAGTKGSVEFVHEHGNEVLE